MPLRSTKNEYAGVNAHLHSNLQNRSGGWVGFHNTYIDAVGQALQARLNEAFPGRYLVDPTKSVQVTEDDPDKRKRSRSPDATINRLDVPTINAFSLGSIPTPTLVLDAPTTVDDTALLTALAVESIRDDGELGETVAWLEVLSPTN